MEQIAAERRIPYRLPLRRPWATAAGIVTVRCGWLLRLATVDGLVGWGDASPFPEIGIGDAQAGHFARECAHLDIAAQRAGVSLSTWLAGTPAAGSIPVNAAVGDLGRLDEVSLQQAIAAGFTTLKIKVGGASPADELARLGELSSQLPAMVRLRLDANRAWDDGQARRFLDGCVALPVESVEEPLRRPDLETLRQLQARVPFALALDESLPDFSLPALFAAPPVRRLVIKPARHGGLVASLDLARQARAAGIECVVTSALESACGLLAVAHLAAAIAPGPAHGLATADWLATDSGLPPPLVDGRLGLPDCSGLGFQPLLY